MRLKLVQLQSALKTLQYDLFYESINDAEIDVELIPEDPGTGQMIDCLKITFNCKSMSVVNRASETSRVLEIYDPKSEQQPRFSKTETRILTD